MKKHPLNPMWDSDLAKLMEPQSKYPCFTRSPGVGCTRYYLASDYETNVQGERIAERFGNLKVLTGGSGLLGAMGKRLKGKISNAGMKNEYSALDKPAILLSGSCSVVTKCSRSCALLRCREL